MTDDQFEILQELLSGIYVQLARTYDVLMVTLDKLGGDAVSLSKEHEQGHILGPSPLLVEEEENEKLD
jgi:hypothetical protein